MDDPAAALRLAGRLALRREIGMYSVWQAWALSMRRLGGLSRMLLLGSLLAGCGFGGQAGAGTPEATSGIAPVRATTESPPVEDAYANARERMVEHGIIALGVRDPQVVEAMRAVPRHEFVPAEYLGQAYENHPLPIGYGQTISQPYIVALMTEALDLESGERVLEIGTGSGYQAAVLAELPVEVFSVEILEPLAQLAAERLARLGYVGVQLRQADGYLGWPEHAPFDAIVVTAAPDHVPQPLLAQLAVGGVLVIPVGPVGGYQELWRITRVEQDRYDSLSLGGVRFVPLVREGSEG